MRIFCRVCVLTTAICLLSPHAYSQNPQQETKPAQQQSAAELHGGDQATIVIKIQQAEQTKEETQAPSNHRIEQRGDGWFWGWSLSDRIAGIAIFVGFLQFLALIATVWVMMGTARRQLRAYVFPHSADIFEGMMLDTPLPQHRNEPGVVMTFKNTGQTPAYKVISWAQITVAEPKDEESLIAPKFEDKFHTTLGADGQMPKTLWYGRALSTEEIDDINGQRKAIYLYGRIKYRDAFRRNRYSDFRLRYNGPFPPPKGVIFFHCEKGNNAN